MAKPKPKTSEELARSTPSKVALAAVLKTGAGSHGGSVRQRNRRERKEGKQQIRSGDWDS